MKKNGTLKMAIMIISIVLISLISFVGIYTQKGGNLKNILPDYKVSKELSGTRFIKFIVDDSTKTVETPVEESEETKKEEVPVNKEEVLTEENYMVARKIITDRLEAFGADNYDVRVNTTSGDISLELEDSIRLDDMMIYIISQGKFEMIDAESKEVLLNNSDIEEARTMYYTSPTGTSVYLDIIFNEEGKAKLEEVSKTYIQTEDEEGKKKSKNVSLIIDGDTITTTYFGQTLSNGQLPLTIGSETTDATVLNDYLMQCEQLAILLSNGVNPIVYEVKTNEYVSPIIDETILKNIIMTAIIALVLIEAYLIIRFRKTGFVSAISMLGFVALHLLVIRFTDTILSLEAMTAVGISVIVQLIFLQGISSKMKKEVPSIDGAVKEELIKNIQIQIPLYIMAILFVFANWATLMSFGTALFWGLVINVIYNYIFTRTMFMQIGGNKNEK